MKLLLENFRKFLLKEESYTVMSTGIVKLDPGDAVKQAAMGVYDAQQDAIASEGGKWLHPDHLHITLLHQKARPEGMSGGKWKKFLKNPPLFEGQISLQEELVKKEKDGKTSWLLYVDEDTQQQLATYIQETLKEKGLDDETINTLLDNEGQLLGTSDGGRRKFHISIANAPIADPEAEYAVPGENVA